ncbi:hypothetical protein [Streptomyces xiaopingdaonensis]|uniref:hypothetical protein n=1 Tax=Streptomyces xiaopingdaonensis TaxID=1565415 RepID=UPI000998560B|nr:hypothetical protein [Streptomyces xiaopingdaonensis]
MTPRLDALGIATTNLPASLTFYRCLCLEPPADPGTAPHTEAAAGGLRMMWEAVLDPDGNPADLFAPPDA